MNGYEWTNEWMNEWINEWMNEWMTEWMNDEWMTTIMTCINKRIRKNWTQIKKKQFIEWMCLNKGHTSRTDQNVCTPW